MENNEAALDGSAQEIAVNHKKPISTDPSPPAKRSHGSAVHSAPFEGIAISVCSPSTDQSEPWEEVDEGDTPFVKKSFGQRPTVASAKAIVSIIVKLSLDRLVSHPENKMLFGATSPNEIRELAESIAETGQQSPIIVTADLEKVGYYTIISGHKRADALRSMGRTEANCQLEDIKDADDRLLRLLEANRQHVPTTEQKIRIGGLYLGFETKKAKARQVAGAKAKAGSEVVEVLTQPQTKQGKAEDDTSGKARDLAAAKVGMSGVSLERGLKILKAADQAEQDRKKETAAELRRILNEKGIDPAYSHAKSLHLIQQTTKQRVACGEAKEMTVAKQGADTPQPPVPASNAHKTDEVVAPAVLLPSYARDAETVSQATKRNAPPPSLADATVDALETDDPPLVVNIITACDKLVEKLEELDSGELTNDQKWNLTRAFDDLSEWFAKHEQALELPGQL